MDNPSIAEATNKIVSEVAGIHDAFIQLMTGHADEYFMDGNYEGEDNKFVWYQAPSKRSRILNEKVIAKFTDYESAQKYADELYKSLMEEKEKGNKYIANVMMV